MSGLEKSGKSVGWLLLGLVGRVHNCDVQVIRCDQKFDWLLSSREDAEFNAQAQAARLGSRGHSIVFPSVLPHNNDSLNLHCFISAATIYEARRDQVFPLSFFGLLYPKVFREEGLSRLGFLADHALVRAGFLVVGCYPGQGKLIRESFSVCGPCQWDDTLVGGPS